MIYFFFVVTQSILYLSSLLYQVFNCLETNIGVEQAANAFYGLQTFWLWILLFTRSDIAFRDSIFKLANCTIYSVYTFFIIMGMIGTSLIIPSIWNENMLEIRYFLIGLMFLSTMVFCVWITIFFIYKLYVVFKGCESMTDDRLLTTITKNTLLSLISIAATLLAIVIWSISFVNYGYVMQIIYSMGFYIDTLTNFICATLMYSMFNDYYQKLCKCCDKKCKSLCAFMMGRDENVATEINSKRKEERALSVSSPSATTNISNAETYISKENEKMVEIVDTNQMTDKYDSDDNKTEDSHIEVLYGSNNNELNQNAS